MSKSVLVVEDDPIIRGAMQLVLEWAGSRRGPGSRSEWQNLPPFPEHGTPW